MILFFHNWSRPKRFGALVLAAALLSFLSFAIFQVECVLNFGDSDTHPIEKAFDDVLVTVEIGALLFWLFAIIYAIVLLFGAIKRRVA